MMSRFDLFRLDDAPRRSRLILVNKARRTTPYRGMYYYGLEIRRLVRALWKSIIGVDEFISLMSILVERGFAQAWHDGIATCGFKPQDMSISEQARLQSEISTEINYISNFAQAIRDGDQISGGKLGPLIMRSQMWTLRYAYIFDLARTFVCGDLKLKWVIGAHIKEHCDDCLMLNGKVYRASEWRARDVSPKMHRLKCGGYRCGCAFVPTDEPVTPAPFPTI